MPGLSAFLKQALLDHAFHDTRYTPAVVSGSTAAIYARLHVGPAGPNCTANPATDPTRQLVTVADPSLVGGFYEVVSSAATTWTNIQTPGLDTPDTLTDFSLWDASTAGNPLARGPLGGFAAVPCSVVGATNACTAIASGFANGNSVEVYPEAGGTLPSGLAVDTRYYVANQGTFGAGTFQLATDQAGASIVDVGDGTLRVVRAVRYAVNSGATVRFPAGQLAIRAA